MFYTIIYADCESPDSLGDFSSAGELAFAIQAYFHQSQLEGKCLLSSSETGIKRFQKLYGNDTQTTLTIHQSVFTAVVFEQYVQTPDSKKTMNYIEMGCKPANNTTIEQLNANAPHIKLLLAILPHITNDAGLIKYYLSQIHADIAFDTVALGLGQNRIGLNCYLSINQSLDHSTYHHLTSHPYGFAYFDKTLDDSHYFLRDYLTIANRSNYHCNHFIFIGDCNQSLRAAILYATENSTIINVIDHSTKSSISYSIDKTKNKLLSWIMPAVNNTSSSIQIMFIPHISNHQMHILMKHAIPLIGVTGVSSMTESIAIGKVPFYQLIETNHLFLTNYLHALIKKHAQSDLKTRSHLLQLLELIVWEKRMTSKEVEAATTFINNKNLINSISERNTILISKPSDIGYAVAKKMNIPTETKPIFQSGFKTGFFKPVRKNTGRSSKDPLVISQSMEKSCRF